MSLSENANRMLRENIARVEEIINFLPMPLLVSYGAAEDACHVYVNEKFTELIGYTTQEIHPRSKWFEVAYPDEAYRQEVQTAWLAQEALARQQAKKYIEQKARVRCKDGVERWFVIKASLEKQHLDIVMFSNVDETETQYQELIQLNKIKDRFLSIVSHDVRSPLAMLQGLLDLIEDKSATEAEVIEMIPAISTQLYHVSHLLDTLLAWTTNHLERIQFRVRDYDLAAIVREAVRQVGTEARKKHIQLSVAVATPCPIAGDGEMLRLLIRNLLSNALKFSHRGGHIQVQLLMDADTVTLSVEDNGVGLSAADIARIYRQEVFTTPGTEHERGIGLGLTLCQSFVRQHGGLFQIESSGGTGTICKVSLPLRQAI